MTPLKLHIATCEQCGGESSCLFGEALAAADRHARGITTRDQLLESLLKPRELRAERQRLEYGDWPRITGIQ